MLIVEIEDAQSEIEDKHFGPFSDFEAASAWANLVSPNGGWRIHLLAHPNGEDDADDA